MNENPSYSFHADRDLVSGNDQIVIKRGGICFTLEMKGEMVILKVHKGELGFSQNSHNGLVVTLREDGH